ncbi:MAG: hypothetical protein OHK93_005750 [Ramalina farinacea]|uniref:Nucleoporin NUP49/NSP49 n=1 Tax=Ramalina farinacea TaxID=258253 RepID=A0AA43QIY9_9LECA|nr:hypothetical protein [Ramalina farinacea]
MQPANSIFGNNNAQQMQPQQGGGLFGSLNSSQPQQAGGLFGSTLNNQNKSSMFGSSQAPSQVQQPNNQQPAPVSIFSNSIGQQSQQQQVVPGVRISVNELRPTTRFNDLHEELQKAIEYVDTFITGQINFQEQCIGASPGLNELSQQMSPDVQHCTKKLESVQQALEGDAESIAFAKHLVRADAADAKLSFKIINNLKLPPQFHHANLWNSVPAAQRVGPSFPDGAAEQGSSRNLIEYFSKQSDDMSKTLAAYKRNIAEVETYLRGVESNAIQEMQRLAVSRNREGGPRTTEDEVKELAFVLRDFENGILGVAARVGGARESVQSVML